ncbi:MAG: adenine deaminase [Sulfurimicrobium sp.]|nr:adenine deaminase [Sulfurimicrobium sp.]
MNHRSGELTANLADIETRTVRYGRLAWRDGIISAIETLGAERPEARYLAPGLIDAHVHIESSMLTPAEFGRQAVCHGTVATVSDPHEIANVLGIEGVRFMLESALASPCRIFYSAPSCVPATPFETVGAGISLGDIAALFDEPRVVALSEMMNFPGVLNGDRDVIAKLDLARARGYPVDGHAPGVLGEAARRYAGAGISTDHECFSLEEARDKIAAGMVVQIREGSAARNFEALHPLITEAPAQVMLCSDDKHPDDLVAGHINRLAARAVAKGHDRFDVLRCACLNPVRHYRLPVGTLQLGDPMDAVLFADLHEFQPIATYVNGAKVAENGRCLVAGKPGRAINRFNARLISAEALCIADEGARMVRVIEAVDGELVTRQRHMPPRIVNNTLEPDPERDMLLLMVLNRYQPDAKPALAFISGFGLRRGAIASSVAHDSHNLIAVGCSREEIARAVNTLVESRGGIAVCEGESVQSLPLPVAGLMSLDPAAEVGRRYAEMDQAAKALGSRLRAPYMTLSFMALLVIPALKLSDKGLFDGARFAFVPLAV